MNTKAPLPILNDLIQSLQTDTTSGYSNEMLSPNQVAQELGMHINTIYRIIGSGQLRSYNLSSGMSKTCYRIKRVDLENYLEERYSVG